jgi:hypothetical protein
VARFSTITFAVIKKIQQNEKASRIRKQRQQQQHKLQSATGTLPKSRNRLRLQNCFHKKTFSYLIPQ